MTGSRPGCGTSCTGCCSASCENLASSISRMRLSIHRFRFPQKTNDLFFRKSLLHVQSPVTWDWTPESAATQFRGDVAGERKSFFQHAGNDTFRGARRLGDRNVQQRIVSRRAEASRHHDHPRQLHRRIAGHQPSLATTSIHSCAAESCYGLSGGPTGCPHSLAFIADVLATFPNAGFHRRLAQLSMQRFCTHPWSPLRMLKL